MVEKTFTENQTLFLTYNIKNDEVISKFKTD